MNIIVTTIKETPTIALDLLSKNLNVSTQDSYSLVLEQKEVFETKGTLQVFQGQTYLNEHQSILFAMLSDNSDKVVALKSAFSDFIMEGRLPTAQTEDQKILEVVHLLEQRAIKALQLVSDLRAEVPYIDMKALLAHQGIDISVQKANKILKAKGIIDKTYKSPNTGYKDLFTYEKYTNPSNGYTGKDWFIVVGHEDTVGHMIKKGLKDA